MNPLTLKLFNSPRPTNPGNSLLNRSAQMTCKAAWLMALAALCVSCALAQNTSSGVQEFTANGKFTVPTGVTSLRIDAYGAGGGGGSANYGGFSGGGGGGGAYNAGAIQVSPGDILIIVVGKGGAGGVFPGGNGSPGGTTKIVNSSHVVVFAANGGQGGQGATSTSNGNPGAGGAAGTFGGIRHAGLPGFGGGSGGGGASGYNPVGYPGLYSVSGIFGGGGNGATVANTGGGPGFAGYLLITW